MHRIGGHQAAGFPADGRVFAARHVIKVPERVAFVLGKFSNDGAGGGHVWVKPFATQVRIGGCSEHDECAWRVFEQLVHQVFHGAVQVGGLGFALEDGYFGKLFGFGGCGVAQGA